MNLTQELTKRPGAGFSENSQTETLNPVEKKNYYPEPENLKIEEPDLSININKTGEVPAKSEPVRLVLSLNIENQNALKISPKTKFQQLTDSIFYNYNREIEKKFTFQGGDFLIANLVSSGVLFKLLENEKILIEIDKESPGSIMLIPKKGINTTAQLKKYTAILKLIEKKLVQLHQTTVIG